MRRLSKLLYFYPAKVLGKDQGVQYLGFKRLLALFSILFFQGTVTSKNPSFANIKWLLGLGWITYVFCLYGFQAIVLRFLSLIYTTYTFTFLTERLLCETAFLKLVTVYYEFQI